MKLKPEKEYGNGDVSSKQIMKSGKQAEKEKDVHPELSRNYNLVL